MILRDAWHRCSHEHAEDEETTRHTGPGSTIGSEEDMGKGKAAREPDAAVVPAAQTSNPAPPGQCFHPGSNVMKVIRAAAFKRQAEERRAHAEGCERDGDTVGALLDRKQADYLEGRAADECKILVPLVAGLGGEVTQAAPDPTDMQMQLFKNTLEYPEMTAAVASSARMRQAESVGDDCLVRAIDAAETVGARDALERMATHQLAAAHTAAMKALARGMKLIDESMFGRPIQPLIVEGTRLINAAARMMVVYQSGHATLARIRQGGRQVVTVQYVQVNDGGQAAVAGCVGPRGGLPGEGGGS